MDVCFGEVRRSLLTKTIVGVDDAEVRRRASELMAWEDEQGDADAYLEDLRATHVVGTPEQALDRLAEFAAGIQRVLVHQLVHTDLESVELIGREVVPAAGSL